MIYPIHGHNTACLNVTRQFRIILDPSKEHNNPISKLWETYLQLTNYQEHFWETHTKTLSDQNANNSEQVNTPQIEPLHQARSFIGELLLDAIPCSHKEVIAKTNFLLLSLESEVELEIENLLERYIRSMRAMEWQE